jgi:hypothetical protein
LVAEGEILVLEPGAAGVERSAVVGAEGAPVEPAAPVLAASALLATTTILATTAVVAAATILAPPAFAATSAATILAKTIVAAAAAATKRLAIAKDQIDDLLLSPLLSSQGV